MRKMNDEDFFNNIETIIQESQKQIVEKEKLIFPENYNVANIRNETILYSNPKNQTNENSAYLNYQGLVIHSETFNDEDPFATDAVKQLLNLSNDEETELVKKKLEAKKLEKNEKEEEIVSNKLTTLKKYGSSREKKKIIRKNKRDDIRNFIDIEKELFITKTLVHKKKKEIDDIYNYINKKDKILKDLKELLITSSEKFQKSLMQNFRKTEEEIKMLEEIASTKKIKKSQVQSLNMEINKLEMELEKKEEHLRELKKCKSFLLKLKDYEQEVESRSMFHETQEKKEETKTEKEKGDIMGADVDIMGADVDIMGADVDIIGSEVDIKKRDETEGKEENKEELFLKKIEKYVKNSQLLIDSFHFVEEKYLQLIDESENAEYELKQIQKKYEDSKKIADIKNKETNKKIIDIENIIQDQKEKIKEYENIIKKNPDNFSFNNISNKIDFIFNQFDYDINTNDISKKLQILENKIYSYITVLTKYIEEDSFTVYEIQRERENERRKKMRFEVNLDRNKLKQTKKETDKDQKKQNKNSNSNPKDKKEKREDIYTKFEDDLFRE